MQVLRCLGAVYSITTFIRAITSLLQIQQFARLRSTTYMQPARFKLHAEKRTCSPVQRPNFRGHAAGDVEVTRAEGGTTPAGGGSVAMIVLAEKSGNWPK